MWSLYFPGPDTHLPRTPLWGLLPPQAERDMKGPSIRLTLSRQHHSSQPDQALEPTDLNRDSWGYRAISVPSAPKHRLHPITGALNPGAQPCARGPGASLLASLGRPGQGQWSSS